MWGVVKLAEVDMDVGDLKVLEKGEKGHRRIVGGRSGESRLEMNADPNHDRTDSLFIVNLFDANGLDRREVDLETTLDELDQWDEL